MEEFENSIILVTLENVLTFCLLLQVLKIVPLLINQCLINLFRPPPALQKRSHNNKGPSLTEIKREHYRLQREQQQRYNEEALEIQREAVRIERRKMDILTQILNKSQDNDDDIFSEETE